MLSGLHPPASQKLKGIIERKRHQFEVLYSITNTSSPKNITKEKKKDNGNSSTGVPDSDIKTRQ